MENLRKVGQEAEDRAADYLLSQGFTIVTRRYKARRGEIDLVALDGDLLVFVEVKHRRGSLLPEEAIVTTKVQAMIAASQQYLADFEVSSRRTRFDVIAIDRNGLRHFRDTISSLPDIETAPREEEEWRAE